MPSLILSKVEYMKKITLAFSLLLVFIFSTNLSAQMDFALVQIKNKLKRQLNFQTNPDRQDKKTRKIKNGLEGMIDGENVSVYIKNYESVEEATKYMEFILISLPMGVNLMNRFGDESFTCLNEVNGNALTYIRKENIYIRIDVDDSSLVVPIAKIVLNVFFYEEIYLFKQEPNIQDSGLNENIQWIINGLKKYK